MPDDRKFLKFEASGALTTGVKDREVFPVDGEIVASVAAVGTAPTGAALIVDLQLNGASMYTVAANANKPTVAIGASNSNAAAVNGVVPQPGRPNVTAVKAGDTLSLNVVQVGSTVAGSDLDVTVEYLTN